MVTATVCFLVHQKLILTFPPPGLINNAHSSLLCEDVS